MKRFQAIAVAAILLLAGGWYVAGLTGNASGEFWIGGLRRFGLLGADVPAFPGFDKLIRRPSGNDALVCPPGMCPQALADIESPVFDMDADRLRERLTAIALAEPRTSLIATQQRESNHLKFQQASKLMRFPDVIDVEARALGSGCSTLALWSRSVVGRRDFGVNLERAKRWLAALGATGAKAKPSAAP